jgi:hypothetical protein
MEIDPGYCDVTIARFEAMTGQPAILDGEDRTFADVTAARAKMHDQNSEIIACVDGPRLTRVDVAFYGVRGCLRSCVRPLNAVVMTAGPDGFREPSALTTKRA